MKFLIGCPSLLLVLMIKPSWSFSLVNSHARHCNHVGSSTVLYNNDAIDVEFIKSGDDQSDKQKQSSSSSSSSASSEGESANTFESPLQASLNMVPPHLQIPIEFTDQVSKSFIPCNAAFVLQHDGVEYTIGTPIHTQVAVYCEDDDGRSYFVDPDMEDNLELLELAAAKFENENSECKITFQRTPRTLTVQGDLDKLTKGWRIEDEVKVEDEVGDVLAESDEAADDAFFESFFEKELGPNYRQELLVDDNPDLDRRAEEMMDFFNVPGLGTEKEDDDGIRDLIKEMEEDQKKAMSEDPMSSREDEAALRLVGFEGPDGRPYSLVKMLQPMILVAKDDEILAPDQRFLLSKQEADKLIPLLEEEFKTELGNAGLQVGPRYE